MRGATLNGHRWWLAALAVLSCRSHEMLCEAADCAPAADGDAGAPAVDLGSSGSAGMAGDGVGGAPSVACVSDAQCQNDQSCDGVERCVSGRCEIGDALTCEHGTACIEHEVASCVYETPSPWLLTVGTSQVRGLPMAELANRELPILAERDVTQVLTGFDAVTFAPNGKVAFVHSLEDQMGSRMQLLRFGQGPPSPLLEIPDLPNWGDFTKEPEFSPDSTRALVYDGFTGTYLVDLTDEPRATELSPLVGEFTAVAFCQDSRYWLEWGDDSAYYVGTVADGEVSRRRLGEGSYTLSPDASLVALKIVDADGDPFGIRLFPCSGASWVESFDESTEATFGPGAQLLLTRAASGMEVVSLEDPQHPVEVWSSPIAELWEGLDFNRDGTKLLVQLPGPDGELTAHVVDLTAPTEPAVFSLRLPAYAQIATLGESSIWAWSSGDSAAPRDLLWQTLEVPDDRQQVMPEPLLVYTDSAQSISGVYGVPLDDKSVFLTRRSDEATALSILRFNGLLLGDRPLAEFPGSIQRLVASPAGYGLVVQTTGATIDNKVWWLSFSPEGSASEPVLLAEESLYVSLQPWP
jgi:hypothetical protein